MAGRPNMVTVNGRCLISLLLLVPVTTTCERVSRHPVRTESTGSPLFRAETLREAAAHRTAVAASTNILFIIVSVYARKYKLSVQHR